MNNPRRSQREKERNSDIVAKSIIYYHYYIVVEKYTEIINATLKDYREAERERGEKKK